MLRARRWGRGKQPISIGQLLLGALAPFARTPQIASRGNADPERPNNDERRYRRVVARQSVRQRRMKDENPGSEAEGCDQNSVTGNQSAEKHAEKTKVR